MLVPNRHTGPGRAYLIILELTASAFLVHPAAAQPRASRDTKKLARLMGVDAADVRILNSVGVYDDGHDIADEDAELVRILNNRALESDVGRTKVLEALLRRYRRLSEMPHQERWPYRAATNPRLVLLSLLSRPIGPEQAIVIDRNLHVLLKHPWIQNIGGMDRLVWNYLRCPNLPHDTFAVLRDGLIRAIRRKGQSDKTLGPWQVVSVVNAHGEPDGDIPHFTLGRDQPADWAEEVSFLYLDALWESPAARASDRKLIQSAVVETVLNASPYAIANEHMLSRLLRRPFVHQGRLDRDGVARIIDQLLRQWPRISLDQQRFIARTFPEVLMARPGAERPHEDRAWPLFVDWWNNGGKDEDWVPSFDQPLVYRVVVIVDQGDQADEYAIVTESVLLEDSRCTTLAKITPHGNLSLGIRAWPAPGEPGTLIAWRQDPVVRPLSEDDVQRQLLENLEVPWPPLPGPAGLKRLRHRTEVSFKDRDRYTGLGDCEQVVVTSLETTSDPTDVREIDLEWVVGRLCQDLSVAQIEQLYLDALYEFDFVPLSQRLRLIGCFLEKLGHGGAIIRCRPTALAMAEFILRRGGPADRAVLQTWFDEQWAGWRRIRKMLQTAPSSTRDLTESGVAEIVALLKDPATRDSTLAELLNPESAGRLQNLDQEQLAAQVALQVLPRIQDAGRQFQFILLLRKWARRSCDYQPLAAQDKRQAAIQAWIDWANIRSRRATREDAGGGA